MHQIGCKSARNIGTFRQSPLQCRADLHNPTINVEAEIHTLTLRREAYRRALHPDSVVYPKPCPHYHQALNFRDLVQHMQARPALLLSVGGGVFWPSSSSAKNIIEMYHT